VTIRLTVDGVRREERTSYGTARLLDVGTARLYLGGVGIAHRAAAVSARLDSLQGPGRATAGSLVMGCVQNFKVRVARCKFLFDFGAAKLIFDVTIALIPSINAFNMTFVVEVKCMPSVRLDLVKNFASFALPLCVQRPTLRPSSCRHLLDEKYKIIF
jgi:hypothetical protein